MKSRSRQPSLPRPASVLDALGTLLKEDHVIGMPPTSVGGGNWPMATGPDHRILRPGIGDAFAGLLALIAPSGGSSGLPKDPAFAADTVVATPTADAANTFRLEIIAHSLMVERSNTSGLIFSL